MEHEGESDTNCSLLFWNGKKKTGRGSRDQERTIETIQTTALLKSEHFHLKKFAKD